MFKSLSLIAISFFFVLFMVSCGENQSHDEHSHEATDTHQGHDHAAHGEGTQYTSAYVCPMHCEGSGSDQEGECPVCGMTYIAQEDHTKDGHMHE